MKTWDPIKVREVIRKALPPGKVVPRHTDKKHFYQVIEVPLDDKQNPIYPSVTGKLQIIKDEGLINYKMNRALDYIFANFGQINGDNLMEHLDIASRVSEGILLDAGDVGTRIHDIRESIFKTWMDTGNKPSDFLSFIPPHDVDVRVTSAIRALQKFVEDRDYIPLACELLVYSHDLKVAGTLDDLGLVRTILSKGSITCKHEDLFLCTKGKKSCLKCGYQLSEHRFALMDIKTSNQFKDHYFFQVALYAWMFYKLTGLKPETCFITKLSKEDGSYKIEDLKKPYTLAAYARYMLKTNEGIEFIKSLRQDNQRAIVPLT